MYGSARIVWTTYSALIVNSIRSEPNAPPGNSNKSTTTPTTTGGSPIETLARICSARRPRKRPTPITNPIGSPMISADAVEISATLTVTQSRLIR